jgi:hypothetical protein
MTVSPLEPLRKPAILRLDRDFQPCSSELGDELYPNGIFEFNITRLLAFIHPHTERFPAEFIELVDIPTQWIELRATTSRLEACRLPRRDRVSKTAEHSTGAAADCRPRAPGRS